LVTVFDRLRSAESAEEVKALYARTLSESPTACPAEVGALRRGVRARLRQLTVEETGDAAVPAGRTARFGGRLARAPRLGGARARVTKAGTSGCLTIIACFLVGRALLGLLAGTGSKATPSPAPREFRVPRWTPRASLSSVPKWKETTPRIDAFLSRSPPDSGELRSLLGELGLTETRIRWILADQSLQEVDYDRLDGLLRAILATKSPDGER
jgi:hypothetical protein